MRIEIKLPFEKKIVLDFGMKEPDFVSATEIKQYSKKEQLSPKLRHVHKQLKRNARRFGCSELIATDLTDQDIALLERRGYRVRMRTKMHKGNVVADYKSWKISV